MQKDLFFKEILIPTGQLTELLVFLTHRHDVRAKLDVGMRAPALAHQLWDPLNRAAAYVLTAPQDALPGVDEAVRALQQALIQTLNLGDTKAAKEHVASAFKRSQLATTAIIVNRLVSNLKHLKVDLPGLIDALNTSMGYASANRTKWLAEVLHPRTAITQGGHPSGWRTFVRNSEWSATAGLLGVSALFPAGFRAQDQYGSRMGRTRLPILWNDVFSVAIAAPNAALTTSSAAESLALPSDVSVRSNMRGWLEVLVKYDPKLKLDARTRAALSQQTGSRIPAELRDHLVVRQYAQEVAWPDLGKAVQKTRTWLAEQETGQPQALEAVTQWLERKKLEEIRKKISAHFSEEERALLSAALRSA